MSCSPQNPYFEPPLKLRDWVWEPLVLEFSIWNPPDLNSVQFSASPSPYRDPITPPLTPEPKPLAKQNSPPTASLTASATGKSSLLSATLTPVTGFAPEGALASIPRLFCNSKIKFESPEKTTLCFSALTDVNFKLARSVHMFLSRWRTCVFQFMRVAPLPILMKHTDGKGRRGKKNAPVVWRRFSVFTFCDGQKKKKTHAWREHVNSFKTGFGRTKPAIDQVCVRRATLPVCLNPRKNPKIFACQDRFPQNIGVQHFGCWFWFWYI